MDNDQINENEILEKLNLLLEKQNHFEEEISVLRKELEKVKQSISIPSQEVKTKPVEVNENIQRAVVEALNPPQLVPPPLPPPIPQPDYFTFEARKQAYYAAQEKQKPKSAKEIEKFIGENLINKIGILITIIGVVIGAKYAIDHQLINPLTRIILGYLVGFVLFGFAIKLKKNYDNFSAVLMSGAMAIFYFLTYAAYDLYALIPQTVAFGLMVLITVFTVYAAIKYDRQVIAHIGMIGAYGIPFLLSDGKGNMVVLFTYMSIINLGIMVLAFKKYWKPIYYVSFVLSWVIFFTWYNTSYKDNLYFTKTFIFLSVFYLIFYVTYLSYNLIKKELFNIWDVILILVNSFVFFGIGYGMLEIHHGGNDYLGLFAFITAIIQALVCGLIYKMKLADWHLFYFISTLALTFLTIAVPVQYHGNWVTLLWVGEAGLLFWIGRVKQINIYESISYLIMILAFCSIVIDWNHGYRVGNIKIIDTSMLPIVNIYFISSLLFVAVFSFINLFNRNENYPTALKKDGVIYKMMQIIMPVFLLTAIYFMFWTEINYYFNALIEKTKAITNSLTRIPYHGPVTDLKNIQIVWLIIYGLFFFSCLSLINIKVLKNKLLGLTNLFFNLYMLIVFLSFGLLTLSELRDSFLYTKTSTELYQPGAFNIYLRYITFLFVIPMLVINYRYIRQEFIDIRLNKVYDLILHTVVLWIVSSELISWVDYFKGDEAYKLGLSILWGAYSLFLIILGISKKKQELRIGAIVLFSVTLLKLFLYDLQDMGTISKTIVFVTLGILLLIISFLYNKYKQKIWTENNE